MKLFALLALALAPLSLTVSAENCIDLENVNPVDPTIQRSRHKGQLYVKLNHASNKDWFTKSDPYVEMWLEKVYKRRSKDIAKNLNPIYNETFCFSVRPGQDKLHVRVINKDTISDDKIGDTSISLDNVFKTGREGPQDYKLPKWFGLRSNGYVNLQMQFVDRA
ncbi:MAG: C2 domain-containing protein [Benniella sp.]|nr:MAG: C2 domain-containing protein [Benniella sp.]